MADVSLPLLSDPEISEVPTRRDQQIVVTAKVYCQRDSRCVCMTEDSTPTDQDSGGAPEDSIEMDELEVYGSPSPTSNGVSNAIESLDRTEPERYLVEWAGETMDYEAAYKVTKIGFGRGGRPILEIEGRRGGEYVIDSNPTGKPRVEYHPPNGNPQVERLTMIQIYDTKFEWKNWVKRRLGL